MSQEVIKIEENIVSSTVDMLHQEIMELIDGGVNDITLDMSAVDVVDSTGIGIIIRIQNTLKSHEGHLVLTSVNNDIMRMFKIMRLDQHITMEEK